MNIFHATVIYLLRYLPVRIEHSNMKILVLTPEVVIFHTLQYVDRLYLFFKKIHSNILQYQSLSLYQL